MAVFCGFSYEILLTSLLPLLPLRSGSRMPKGASEGVDGRLGSASLAVTRHRSVSIHHHPSQTRSIIEPLQPGGARHFPHRPAIPLQPCLVKTPPPGNRAPSASLHAPPPTSPSSPPHPPFVQNAHAQVVTAQIQVKPIKRKDNDPQSRHKQTIYRIYNNKNNAFYCFSFLYFLTMRTKRPICIVSD